MSDTPGVINGISSYTGKQLANTAKNMFGTESITTEQLALLSDYLVPSQYLLRNHRIKNGRQRFTFSIPRYGDSDPNKALSHRP